VIAKIKTRQQRGIAKYGLTMERSDLTTKDWLIHAQEEAMDFVIYLERLIRDWPTPCNHAEYSNEKHGRFCYCGKQMWDAGD